MLESKAVTKREAEARRRTDLLISDFERYLSAFDADPAFRRLGQRENHVATITRRRQLGTTRAAVRDTEFLALLYKTLGSWGIGQRGSKLVGFEEFLQTTQDCEPAIVSLEKQRLDQPGLEHIVNDRMWNLVESLAIVENEAKLVPCTKALHHLLPDLFVPMDRAFTRVFFGWHGPQFQYQQKIVFSTAYEHFARIARETNPAQFIGAGWRTSLTKNIDNAVVGFCRVERLAIPS
jgi:hypothetical protein